MKFFLSFAREDAAPAGRLRAQLTVLGHGVSADSVLHGGQPWWDAILERIADCDAIIVVVSSASLRSNACSAERQYARALGKPILPISVEPVTEDVPQDLAAIQMVHWAQLGDKAAFDLGKILEALPAAPALPKPMPAKPPLPHAPEQDAAVHDRD